MYSDKTQLAFRVYELSNRPKHGYHLSTTKNVFLSIFPKKCMSDYVFRR